MGVTLHSSWWWHQGPRWEDTPSSSWVPSAFWFTLSRGQGDRPALPLSKCSPKATRGTNKAGVLNSDGGGVGAELGAAYEWRTENKLF